MTKKIIFIDSPNDVDLIEASTEDVVVSTSLQAISKLRERGIKYRETTDFFGESGHKFVSKSSSDIVDIFEHSLSNFPYSNPKYAYERTAVFHFRFFANYLYTQIYIIREAIKQLEPEVICFFVGDKRANGGPNLSLFGDMIVECAALYGTPIKKITGSRERIFPLIRVSNMVKKITFHLLLPLYRRIVRKKRLILLPDHSYGISALLEDAGSSEQDTFPVYLSCDPKNIKSMLIDMLRVKAFSFFSLPVLSNKDADQDFMNEWHSRMRKVQKDLFEKNIIAKPLGVNIAKYISDYLHGSLTGEIYALHGKVRALGRVVSARRPDAVLSQHAVGVSYALGEICSKEGIPGILITHGSHVPHMHSRAKSEWHAHARTLFCTHYPYVAVQTFWAKSFLESQKRLYSQPINTGPLIFAKKQKQSLVSSEEFRKKKYGSNSKEKILLHAGTPKSWSAFRPWIYETVDEYIRNINKLIVAVEKVPGVYLAIRYREIEGLKCEDFKNLLLRSNCYGVFDDGQFSDYLTSADMLVSYSSTALEEALHNKVPILQYDPDGKYWHIPECSSHDKKNRYSPVECANTLEDLIKILKALVNGDKTSKYQWDKYLIHKNAKWLYEILNQ